MENTKVARSSLNLRIFLLYPLAGLFEYLFIFWLHRHLPIKQVLISKQSAKGYEWIIQENLKTNFSRQIDIFISRNFLKACCLPIRSVVEAEVFPTEFMEEATVEPFGRFSWSRSLSSSCCCCWNEKAIWKMSKTITRCIFFWIHKISSQRKERETRWSNVLPNVKRRE